MPTCSDCYYFDEMTATEGKCREPSPSVVSIHDHRAYWPVVNAADDWCGAGRDRTTKARWVEISADIAIISGGGL